MESTGDTGQESLSVVREILDLLIRESQLLSDSLNDPDLEDDDENGANVHKYRLQYHEVQTVARMKGLLHCISNDSTLSQSVRHRPQYFAENEQKIKICLIFRFI